MEELRATVDAASTDATRVPDDPFISPYMQVVEDTMQIIKKRGRGWGWGEGKIR